MAHLQISQVRPDVQLPETITRPLGSDTDLNFLHDFRQIVVSPYLIYTHPI